MTFRAIYFIFIMFVFTLFVAFNLNSKADINLFFIQFQQIPVFLISLCSFLVGFVLTIPFLFKSSKKTVKPPKEKKKKIEQKQQPPVVETSPVQTPVVEANNTEKPKKKSFFGFGKKKDNPKTDDIQKDEE